jgi:hypothetical protein
LRSGLSSVALAALCAAGSPARAVPPGSADGQASLDLCEHADEIAGAEQERVLQRGLELAEQAISTNERDALAHFAAFCNLGKQMRREGAGLLRLTGVWRLRREIEATLTLAPDDPDALVGQGVLLLGLPRLFGGDAEKADRAFRRALELEPSNPEAREYVERHP